MRISHGTYRGVIATLAVIGAFIVGMTQLILTGDADVPAWVAGLVGSIIAYYFGERAAVVASRNGHNGADSAAERAAITAQSDKQ